MKIVVNEDGNIQLEKVFNPIELVSDSGERIVIIMRDSGFELTYQQSVGAYTSFITLKNGNVKL
jgi:hypothetical protein